MFVRHLAKLVVGLVMAMGLTTTALAHDAAVLDVKVSTNGDGTYTLSTTVFHKDTGWQHYADKWDVLTPDGQLIATRVLYHPHVDEQPFTRSLSRVAVPIGVREVLVRAHCSVDGDGKKSFRVALPPRR